jgi:excisionase family DNA binding protein
MSQRKIRLYTLDDLNSVITISVEETSHLLGISRTATYEAINRNEIAIVRYGRRMRVLAKPLYEILSGRVAQATT